MIALKNCLVGSVNHNFTIKAPDILTQHTQNKHKDSRQSTVLIYQVVSLSYYIVTLEQVVFIC